jgi:hypothetical protein
MADLVVARPQAGWPAAIFYPLGHPTPYAYTINKLRAQKLLTALANHKTKPSKWQ